MHRLQELVRQYRFGTTVRKRCRVLKMSTPTEKKYRAAIKAAGLLEGSPTELPSPEELQEAVKAAFPAREPTRHVSSVDRWMEELEKGLKDGAGPLAMHQKLGRKYDDYDGSLSSVKRAYRRLRKARGPRAEDVVIIVDTAPGDVAQVDFGEIVRIPDENGQLRRAWIFVMVLGYSRMMYVEVVRDQRAETWMRLHANAFEFFGAVPQTVVPDNLKAAVIRAAFGFSTLGNVVLNRSYAECARHYGFTIDPTPAYSPEKKGKVESGVRYVKSNFIKSVGGFSSVAEANVEVLDWLSCTANVRIHGTTHERPVDRFVAEHPAMKPLPTTRHEPVVWYEAKVHKDAHIIYKRRKYSAPWTLIGQVASVRATSHDLRIYVDGERVATHDPRSQGQRSTIAEHLPEGRRELAERSLPVWLSRAEELGEDVHAFATSLIEDDSVQSKLPEIQKLVTVLQKYPKARAQAACRRALHFGVSRAQGVRNILEEGLDRTPQDPPVQSKALSRPRFARDAQELFAFMEDSHVTH